MIFNFNYIKLANDYLPPVLRKNLNLQFISGLLKPIIKAATYFKEFQNQGIVDSKTWGSVILLEYYLNNYSLATYPIYLDEGSENFEFLNIYGRQDYIDDDTIQKNYIYVDDVDLATNAGEFSYLFSKNDLAGEEYDFVVKIEERDYNDINVRNNIEGLIRRFKCAGFTHNLQIYNI